MSDVVRELLAAHGDETRYRLILRTPRSERERIDLAVSQQDVSELCKPLMQVYLMQWNRGRRIHLLNLGRLIAEDERLPTKKLKDPPMTAREFVAHILDRVTSRKARHFRDLHGASLTASTLMLLTQQNEAWAIRQALKLSDGTLEVPDGIVVESPNAPSRNANDRRGFVAGIVSMLHGGRRVGEEHPRVLLKKWLMRQAHQRPTHDGLAVLRYLAVLLCHTETTPANFMLRNITKVEFNGREDEDLKRIIRTWVNMAWECIVAHEDQVFWSDTLISLLREQACPPEARQDICNNITGLLRTKQYSLAYQFAMLYGPTLGLYHAASAHNWRFSKEHHASACNALAALAQAHGLVITPPAAALTYLPSPEGDHYA